MFLPTWRQMASPLSANDPYERSDAWWIRHITRAGTGKRYRRGGWQKRPDIQKPHNWYDRQRNARKRAAADRARNRRKFN